MNKILFKTLILIVTFFSLTFLVKDNVSASAMDTLFGAKKCNYVDNKLYQPFSGIDDSFPGAKGLVNGGCINVSGGTEGILKTAYTIAISLIILLAVINIAVSGIQYMTEEAAGQIKGAAKKRLTNSIIALGLALLSYTILYTINKQLVEFTFNPTNLTKNTSQLTKNTTSNISIIQGPKAPPKAPEGPTVVVVRNGGGGTNNTGNTNSSINPLSSNFNSDDFYSNIYSAYNNSRPGAGKAIAKIDSIKNPTLPKAMASGGVINISGEVFPFRSGAGGNGYLPLGTYRITNCRIRKDISVQPTMFIDGFGYSCDLNDVYDPRTKANRTLLRIHPDGGGPGTIGCIGIVGDVNTQRRFWSAVKTYTAANQGSATITVTR